MVIIAEMNVLAVGMEDRVGEFDGLPVRLLDMAHGSDAIHAFKTDSIDSVISHWNLIDMPDGEFLKRLKAVRPDNHWFDCLVGCGVAASMEGVKLFETEVNSRPRTTRIKLSELQRNRTVK